MKLFLTLFLYFTAHILLGQQLNTNDSAKIINLINVNDTIDSVNLDTKEVQIPIAENAITKVILVKEKTKESTDWMKYILPVLTLILGIFLKHLYDEWKERKTIRKKGKRYVLEVENLREPLISQIEKLDKEINETPVKSGVSSLAMNINLKGNIFQALDKNDLFEYLKTKNGVSEDKAVKLASEVYGYISVLTSLHTTVESKYQEYLNEQKKYFDLFSEKYKLLILEYNNYLITSEKVFGSVKNMYDSSKHKNLHSLFQKYGACSDLSTIKKNFFPFIMIELSILRHDQYTDSMRNYAYEANNYLSDLEMREELWKQLVTQFKTLYENNLNELNTLLEKIK